MHEPGGPRLSLSLRWRLSALWFLQMAIWGSWFTYLPRYLEKIDMSPAQQGLILASMGIGLWVAPLLAGQVADRWLPTERYLAISHLFGGILLFLVSGANEYWQWLVLAPLYATAYIPTWALASSLSFHHLSDRNRQFGGIRLYGTLGWVIAGWTFALWLNWGSSVLPASNGWPASLGWKGPQDSDCFRQAGMLSFLLAAFCLFLPHTPPPPSRSGGLAISSVLRLFTEPGFSFFMVVCFLLAVALALYFHAKPKFLKVIGIEDKSLTAVQTLGQISEIPALLLLPKALKELGIRGTFAVGIGAWTLRFLIFYLGGPLWLVVASITLHGLCHVFILVVAQFYIDSQCRADARASAQNFLGFVALGIGLPLGFVLAGLLAKSFTVGRVTDYQRLFLVATVASISLLTVFWFWFPEPKGWLHRTGQPQDVSALS